MREPGEMGAEPGGTGAEMMQEPGDMGAEPGGRGADPAGSGAEHGLPSGAPHGTQRTGEGSGTSTREGQGAGSAAGGASPGGGLFENVSKALVGTLLCLVDVRGEACMCSSKFGACAEQGGGKSACIGVLAARFPWMDVR